MIPYLRDFIPAPRIHRFYFGHGTEDMENQYSVFQKRADVILREAGYRCNDDRITRVFIGHGHTEADWRARVDQPLRFLLDPR